MSVKIISSRCELNFSLPNESNFKNAGDIVIQEIKLLLQYFTYQQLMTIVNVLPEYECDKNIIDQEYKRIYCKGNIISTLMNLALNKTKNIDKQIFTLEIDLQKGIFKAYNQNKEFYCSSLFNIAPNWNLIGKKHYYIMNIQKTPFNQNTFQQYLSKCDNNNNNNNEINKEINNNTLKRENDTMLINNFLQMLQNYIKNFGENMLQYILSNIIITKQIEQMENDKRNENINLDCFDYNWIKCEYKCIDCQLDEIPYKKVYEIYQNQNYDFLTKYKQVNQHHHNKIFYTVNKTLENMYQSKMKDLVNIIVNYIGYSDDLYESTNNMLKYLKLFNNTSVFKNPQILTAKSCNHIQISKSNAQITYLHFKELGIPVYTKYYCFAILGKFYYPNSNLTLYIFELVCTTPTREEGTTSIIETYYHKDLSTLLQFLFNFNELQPQPDGERLQKQIHQFIAQFHTKQIINTNCIPM